MVAHRFRPHAASQQEFATVMVEGVMEFSISFPQGRDKEVLFFLERKNQRTFIRLASPFATARTQMDKSLFASFSSEKEGLPVHLPGKHNTL
jgi:hypothetical protein